MEKVLSFVTEVYVWYVIINIVIFIYVFTRRCTKEQRQEFFQQMMPEFPMNPIIVYVIYVLVIMHTSVFCAKFSFRK